MPAVPSFLSMSKLSIHYKYTGSFSRFLWLTTSTMSQHRCRHRHYEGLLAGCAIMRAAARSARLLTIICSGEYGNIHMLHMHTYIYLCVYICMCVWYVFVLVCVRVCVAARMLDDYDDNCGANWRWVNVLYFQYDKWHDQLQ